jgi:5-(carboxyamino)imidazole ribonucleotide synthase
MKNTKFFYRDLQIGILGGGQLGRMLLQAAIDYNLQIHILDGDPHAPCASICQNFEVGKLTDYDTVYNFGKKVDVITIEIENVNTEALIQLKKEGKIIFPQPEIIQMIQDKRRQKEWLVAHHIPTADFVLTQTQEELHQYPHFFPAVHKLATGGYDGRGVQVLKTTADIPLAFNAPSVLERCIEIEKELCVLVARNPQGEMKTFPIVEMVFHPVANLVDYLFSPAAISSEIQRRANFLAEMIVREMDYVGIMAVEMFWDKNGELWINELAPRPHNSGHHTIRSCSTSQYEQHLRAILGLPLGSPQLLHPAAMLNLLGEEGYAGNVIYDHVEMALQIEGVYPHFYGKSTTKPFRKMGHVTILEDDPQLLQLKIKKVKHLLKVIATQE